MARRRRRNHKWIIGGLILVLIIAVGVAAVVIWNNAHSGNGQADETEVVEEGVKDVEKRNEETEEEYSKRMVEQKKVKQYEGENPNEAGELTGAVTYAGVNDGTLMIGMNIDQFLSEGNCALSLVRGGDVVYSANAKIVAEVSTSTCDGFSVPVNGLGSGTTEIIIKLSAGEKTGTIRGEVNI